jgi:Tol biopolymer transport system component
MDPERRRRVVATAKGAAWPAWSNDGARIVFLQPGGRKKYRLMAVSIGRATI